MKKKIIISSLAVFVLISLTIAQSLNKELDKEAKERLFILKYEPIQLLDPLSTIQFSFEKQCGAHQSYQVGLGYIFNDYMIKSKGLLLDKDAANLKLRGEYRLYCKDFASKRVSWFFAPQIFYKQAFFENKSSGTYKDPWSNNTVQYINNYSVQSKIYGLYTKTGFQKIRKNGFVFELYFGPGFEYVNTKTTGIKLNNQENYQHFNSNPLGIPDFSIELKETQKEMRLCFTIGISLGWSFSNVAE
jgi:hypothetical protein